MRDTDVTARIWIDADSCPTRVREGIARAAERVGGEAVFVAVKKPPLPRLSAVTFLPAGDQIADDVIVERIGPDEIAITRDIPLAARLVEKGACVMNDRGDTFTTENIRERLSIRDFMHEARIAGIAQEGERSFGAREVKAFASAFDRELMKIVKKNQR